MATLTVETVQPVEFELQRLETRFAQPRSDLSACGSCDFDIGCRGCGHVGCSGCGSCS